jgi:NADPH:quinone reductase-like Zn-dependent oxidoreductase
VHAASLNYRDLITVNMRVSHELVPLSDGAGVVEDVGEEVVHLKIGDRVVGLFFPLWQSGNIDTGKFAVARGGVPTDGMLAQCVYGLEDSFVKFPEMLQTFWEISLLSASQRKLNLSKFWKEML